MTKRTSHLEALILDLDHCIFDPVKELGEHFVNPMLLVAWQRGLSDALIEQIRIAAWRVGFTDALKSLGISDADAVHIIQAFKDLRASKGMRTYGDMDHLNRIECRKFLVTSGYLGLQSSKVESLGIAHRFQSVTYDVTDDPDRIGKQGIFAQLLKTYHLDPRDVAVIGDNPHSELAAGRALGITTIQTLRPGVVRGDADYYIKGFDQLPSLLATHFFDKKKCVR